MLRNAILSSALLLAGAFSANAATVTLFDDDFNADSAGVIGSSFVTTTSLNKWNVTQGNVDILGPAYCTGCIDLDGSGLTVPAILQTKEALNFLDGISYTFSFFFAAGSEDEIVTLSLSNGAAISFAAGKTPSVFTTPGGGGALTSPLFLSLSGPVNNFGPYLDRVLVTYDVAPVPLPAAAPLLLAALGGLGLMARRRRAAA